MNPCVNLKLLVMVGQETVMVGQEIVLVGQMPTHAHPWLRPWYTVLPFLFPIISDQFYSCVQVMYEIIKVVVF